MLRLIIKTSTVILFLKFVHLATRLYASDDVSEMKFDKTMELGPNPKTSFDKFEVEEIELEETITIVYGIVKK